MIRLLCLRPSLRRRFEQAASEYIAHREVTVAEGTVAIDKWRLPHLKRALDNCLVRDINAGTIRNYQAERARVVSARTVNLEVKLLRGTLKAEDQWKRLGDDVKPLKENREKPGRALTDGEALRLFEIAESNPRWFVAYLANCDCQRHRDARGGIEELELGHVNLDGRMITIRRSKNDSGIRQVVLTNDALSAVTKLVERARALG